MSKDTATQPVDSIEDDISTALDELETEEVETEEEIDEEPEPEQGDDTEGEPDEEIEEEPEESDPQENVEEPEEDKLTAPEHWPERDKELFNKQSKESQEWLLERHKAMEGDYTRSKQEFAAEKRQFDAVKDALSPYRHDFERAGLDYAGAVRQLASWDNALRTGGRNAILQLAQAYNIDLAEPESDEYIDPQVKAVQDEIAKLKQYQSQQSQVAQRSRQEQIYQTIQTFREEQDGSGKLLHPHFDALKDDMARLINTGLAKDLNDGYSKALALRPDLAPKEPVAPKVDQAERVRRAKKAATGVKSSGAVAKKNREKMTLEQEIASHFS